MEQALEKPGIVVIVKECRECRGMGIKIGRVRELPSNLPMSDGEKTVRIARECGKCVGWGIKIIRRRENPVETA